MINALKDVVESRILEAHENGEFDNLPGKGQPLQLDDDRLVPEELRAAYQVLKNAGFVPPELDKVCNSRPDSKLLPAAVFTGVADIADRACRVAGKPAHGPARVSAASRYYGHVINKLTKSRSPKS
jgi:hypothetical protein